MSTLETLSHIPALLLLEFVVCSHVDTFIFWLTFTCGGILEINILNFSIKKLCYNHNSICLNIGGTSDSAALADTTLRKELFR